MSLRQSAAPDDGAAPHPDAARPGGSWRRGRWTLLLIAVICAAPVAGAYFAYYVARPHTGTTSYGALIDPQRPVPSALATYDDAGRPAPLAALRGRWLLLSVDGGPCGDPCATKLYFMRQVRATQGPERERIVTVWLRTGAAPVPPAVRAAYPDTRMLRADPAAVAAWLPAEAGTSDADHIYVVDPNGNLMMRFPASPDPTRIKNDVTRLLAWSSIG